MRYSDYGHAKCWSRSWIEGYGHHFDYFGRGNQCMWSWNWIWSSFWLCWSWNPGVWSWKWHNICSFWCSGNEFSEECACVFSNFTTVTTKKLHFWWSRPRGDLLPPPTPVIFGVSTGIPAIPWSLGLRMAFLAVVGSQYTVNTESCWLHATPVQGSNCQYGVWAHKFTGGLVLTYRLVPFTRHHDLLCGRYSR